MTMTTIQNRLPSSRKFPLVKSLVTFAAAAVLCMGQAQATIVDVDFEDSAFSDVSLFVNSNTVEYKNVLFKTESLDDGLSGALIDGSDPFTFFNLGFPGNNLSSYYAAVNNGWFSIQHKISGAAIRLKGLDFSFIAPLPGFINFSVGQLVVAGQKADGSFNVATRDFAGQDEKGNWQFSNWNNISEELGGGKFTNISVLACLYTESGNCAFVENNQAQFAVDNLSIDVSAPATTGLFALSLAGLFAANRRRQQTK